MKTKIIATFAVVGAFGIGGFLHFGNDSKSESSFPQGRETIDADTEAPSAPAEHNTGTKVEAEPPAALDPPAENLRPAVKLAARAPAENRPLPPSMQAVSAEEMPEIDPGDLQKTTAIRKAIADAFEDSRETARSLVLTLPAKGVFLSAYKRLGQLEADNAEEAIAFTAEIGDDAGLASFYGGLIEGVAATDPDFAIDLHEANREMFPETGTIASIVAAATRAGNPNLALWSIRKKLAPEQHDQYFAKVYGTWAAIDPEAAIADISRRGQSSARGAGAGAIFRQWVRIDQSAVENWLSNHPQAGFLNWQARKALQNIPKPLDENVIVVPAFR